MEHFGQLDAIRPDVLDWCSAHGTGDAGEILQPPVSVRNAPSYERVPTFASGGFEDVVPAFSASESTTFCRDHRCDALKGWSHYNIAAAADYPNGEAELMRSSEQLRQLLGLGDGSAQSGNRSKAKGVLRPQIEVCDEV